MSEIERESDIESEREREKEREIIIIRIINVFIRSLQKSVYKKYMI